MHEAIFPADRPLFYYITDRRSLSGENLLKKIRSAVEWGVDFVQIREKDLPDFELFDLTRRSVSLARKSPCKILVNGRADIALAAGAHGVHLPSTGLRPADLFAWLPKGFLVGVSAHSGREVTRAAQEGADYALLGPIFPTLSKLAYGPAIGLQAFRRMPNRWALPIFGLGGIGPEQVLPVIEMGAVGVAGISLFQNKLRHLCGSAIELRRKIKDCGLRTAD